MLVLENARAHNRTRTSTRTRTHSHTTAYARTVNNKVLEDEAEELRGADARYRSLLARYQEATERLEAAKMTEETLEKLQRDNETLAATSRDATAQAETLDARVKECVLPTSFSCPVCSHSTTCCKQYLSRPPQN